MFYGQCWECGERWRLGTASTCTCPEELPAYTFKPPSEPVFALLDTKPNYNITFQRDNKQVGVLDFNGPEMTFSGDMDESAKAFLDWVANAFKGRLDQERADEREACAKVCDEAHELMNSSFQGAAAAIRARSNT
jgi:hypothetical protein